MGNLFQKHKLLFVIAGGIFILAVIIALTSYSQNRTDDSNQNLSTPELIDRAYNRGQITEEERLLYLAYAIYEYESLPTRLRGSVEWEGSSVIMDLNRAVVSPATVCSMSPYVQNELRRVLPNKLATCN